MRGLKQDNRLPPDSGCWVAPPAGAWIETLLLLRPACSVRVAPPAGAWIETCSLAPHGSGAVPSHPLRVRGLKPINIINLTVRAPSHPLRVRGLKRRSGRSSDRSSQSHPLRVRGLKLFQHLQVSLDFTVAPPAGAWIETGILSFTASKCRPSHPLRVRGLKLVLLNAAIANR